MASRFTAAREETRTEHVQRVLRVIVHIEDRLDGPLGLEAMARRARMSPFHFQRVFRGIVGESPSAFARRIRLERAAASLRCGETQKRCAAVAGFARVEPFSRAFRRRFGQPPGSWRAAAPHRAAGAFPRELRLWVNRPGPDAQMCFLPVPAAAASARGRGLLRVDRLPALRVAFLRRVGDDRGDADDFAQLCRFAAHERWPAEEPMFLRLRHDDPVITPAERRRVDRCVAVGPRRRGDGEIGIRTLPSGDYVVATHEGSRGSLERFARWMEGAAREQLRTARRPGPRVEIPLDDPRGRGARVRLTDVLIPVQPGPTAARWYWRRRRPLP